MREIACWRRDLSPAVLKWLIAAFKDPSAEQRRSIHAQVHKSSRKTVRINEDLLNSLSCCETQ